MAMELAIRRLDGECNPVDSPDFKEVFAVDLGIHRLVVTFTTSDSMSEQWIANARILHESYCGKGFELITGFAAFFGPALFCREEPPVVMVSVCTGERVLIVPVIKKSKGKKHHKPFPPSFGEFLKSRDVNLVGHRVSIASDRLKKTWGFSLDHAKDLHTVVRSAFPNAPYKLEDMAASVLGMDVPAKPERLMEPNWTGTGSFRDLEQVKHAAVDAFVAKKMAAAALVRPGD